MIRIFSSLILLTILSVGGCSHIPAPEDNKRYFGQQRPGMTPERFAPGIVSTESLEIGGVFLLTWRSSISSARFQEMMLKAK